MAGVPADDGGRWTFSLSALTVDVAGGNQIDVAIVPTLDTEAPAGAQQPFQIAFENVDGSSLETERPPEEATPEDFSAALEEGFVESDSGFDDGDARPATPHPYAGGPGGIGGVG